MGGGVDLSSGVLKLLSLRSRGGTGWARPREEGSREGGVRGGEGACVSRQAGGHGLEQGARS